ncbi:I66 family serine proteinase inhibitor [Nocardia brasiliensis]|uniref:I66 family serine proteinase inhibitor n=1 Tax=Nocardia brasiliensis TaxID=37326 RepID=UPI00366C2B4C
MEIESGFYYLRNLASGKYIGRLLAEDQSLLPKRVVSLPNQFAGQTRFLFEKMSDNGYKVTVNGGRLIEIDERLFAALLPEPDPDQRWNLAQDERTGANHFVIIDPDKGFERALKDTEQEDRAQLAVGFVPVGRSFPPFYPPDAVWAFERADD